MSKSPPEDIESIQQIDQVEEVDMEGGMMMGGTQCPKEAEIIPNCCPPAPWCIGKKDEVGCMQRPCASVFCCYEKVMWTAIPNAKCQIGNC